MMRRVPAEAQANLRSNEAWLAALRAHDRLAVDELSHWLRGALAKAARGWRDVSEADLDDFVQESIMHVMHRLDRFGGDSRFTTWATAVAIRVALTQLRKRRHTAAARGDGDAMKSAAQVPAAGETPPGRSARAELLAQLRQSIESDLTDKQRDALKAFLSGAPQVVLAERLGMTGGAFHKLMHDARQRLKAALQRHGHNEDAVRSILQGAA